LAGFVSDIDSALFICRHISLDILNRPDYHRLRIGQLGRLTGKPVFLTLEESQSRDGSREETRFFILRQQKDSAWNLGNASENVIVAASCALLFRSQGKENECKAAAHPPRLVSQASQLSGQHRDLFGIKHPPRPRTRPPGPACSGQMALLPTSMPRD